MFINTSLVKCVSGIVGAGGGGGDRIAGNPGEKMSQSCMVKVKR